MLPGGQAMVAGDLAWAGPVSRIGTLLGKNGWLGYPEFITTAPIRTRAPERGTEIEMQLLLQKSSGRPGGGRTCTIRNEAFPDQSIRRARLSGDAGRVR